MLKKNSVKQIILTTKSTFSLGIIHKWRHPKFLNFWDPFLLPVTPVKPWKSLQIFNFSTHLPSSLGWRHLWMVSICKTAIKQLQPDILSHQSTITANLTIRTVLAYLVGQMVKRTMWKAMLSKVLPVKVDQNLDTYSSNSILNKNRAVWLQLGS